MAETTLLTEQLDDGTTREWLMAGKEYTDTAEQRATVLAAVQTMRWHRPDAPLPMSPGLLLREVVAELGVKLVAYLGYSIKEIRHPDCTCDDPYHADHWATYQLVGIKVRQRRSWWTTYWLDIGVGAVWLVSDVAGAPDATGFTGWCAMDWHERCSGLVGQGDRRRACECACHALGA